MKTMKYRLNYDESRGSIGPMIITLLLFVRTCAGFTFFWRPLNGVKERYVKAGLSCEMRKANDSVKID